MSWPLTSSISIHFYLLRAKTGFVLLFSTKAGLAIQTYRHVPCPYATYIPLV